MSHCSGVGCSNIVCDGGAYMRESWVIDQLEIGWPQQLVGQRQSCRTVGAFLRHSTWTSPGSTQDPSGGTVFLAESNL